MRHRLICLLALCALGQTAVAQTTVPHTFTSGTAARASQVNENFQALVTAIDSLAARVSKLEGGETTDADIVGTYKFSSLQIGIGWLPAGMGDVEGITYEGTFTFAADRTFTATFTGRRNDSRGPSPDDGAISGTWALEDNDVVSTIEGNEIDRLHCASGCRVLFGTLYGPASAVNDDGHTSLAILVRVN